MAVAEKLLSVNSRTKKINKAVAGAKARDGYMCLVCKLGHNYGLTLDGAHLLPRNNPAPNNDPTDTRNIMTLCRKHHKAYDSLNHSDKGGWLKENGLYHFAERLAFLRGER